MFSQRIEIIKRREAFERNPEAFNALWSDENQAIQKHIIQSRKSV
jgi:magnesium chelatase subunit I